MPRKSPVKLRPIFIDRDGVINQFPGVGNYVTSLKQLKMLPRSAKAIACLSKAGYHPIVITNQGCVARGLITHEELRLMTAKIERAVSLHGGRLHGLFYCPHRLDDKCRCKKPKTLLVKRALQGHTISKKNIFFIGDSREDIQCGRRSGFKTILVLSGRNKLKNVPELGVEPHYIKNNLWEAVQFILQKKY